MLDWYLHKLLARLETLFRCRLNYPRCGYLKELTGRKVVSSIGLAHPDLSTLLQWSKFARRASKNDSSIASAVNR